MKILNDVHIGAARSGGTTPASASALRAWVLEQFRTEVAATTSDLCILGDLFDSHTIPSADIAETFNILNLWCINNPNSKLILVRGNHDINPDSSKLSSFDMLSSILSTVHLNVLPIQAPTLYQNCYIIPHLQNQTQLDEALQDVPSVQYLLVHTNYDNNFAKESDHSLNISKEQASAAPVQHIIFAHEHQSRTDLQGKVVIPGNQVPTSISDCLGGKRQWVELTGAEPILHDVENPHTYVELDWASAEPVDVHFVRLVGTAEAGQAADVANTVAKYRRNSQAFVVGNAVKVASDKVDSVSVESVQGFNVMETLKELLTKDELKIIESLT